MDSALRTPTGRLTQPAATQTRRTGVGILETTGTAARGLTLGRRQLREAAQAWNIGGTLALGLWLSKHKPHFSTRDYGELVGMVRMELGDQTDYSKEG